MRFGLLLANVTVNKVTAVGIARCIDNNRHTSYHNCSMILLPI